MLRQALQGLCPKCEDGPLFAGVLKLRDQCPNCGLDYTNHDIGDGPIFFVMTILCFTIVPAAVLVEFSYRPSIWTHIILWSVLSIVGSLAMLRPLRAFFLAQKYRHRPEETGGAEGDNM